MASLPPKHWFASAFGLMAFGVLLLCLSGFWLFKALVVPLHSAHLARDWQEVPCLILSSGIKELPRAADEPRSFMPDIHYSYTFGGKDYESDRYYLGTLGGSEARATALQLQYPPHTQARAFVNPARPQEAVLTREMRISWFICVPALLGVGGAGLLLGGLAQARAAKPRSSHTL